MITVQEERGPGTVARLMGRGPSRRWASPLVALWCLAHTPALAEPSRAGLASRDVPKSLPADGQPGFARPSASLLVVVSDESPTREHLTHARTEALAQPAGQDFTTGWSMLTPHFPHFTSAGPALPSDAFSKRLGAQRALHLNGAFASSDDELEDALELAERFPELLADVDLFERLITATAMGFDGLRVRRLMSQAQTLVARVVARWSFAPLKPNTYPSTFYDAWEAARRDALSNTGWLSVSTLPIERERRGGCTLHVNGPRIGALPLLTPLTLPAGRYLIQVRCGHVASWLQAIEIKPRTTTTARIPLDAMAVTRPDPETQSLVMVAPAPGDLETLIIGLADMTGIPDIRVARITGRAVSLHLYDPQTGSPIDTRRAPTVTSPDRTLPIALIASGAALALGGVGFHVWSEEAKDRGADAIALFPTDPARARVQHREAVSDLELRRALVFTGYGLGGALIIAGVIVWVVDDEPDTTARLLPWLSQEGGGFVWQRDF